MQSRCKEARRVVGPPGGNEAGGPPLGALRRLRVDEEVKGRPPLLPGRFVPAWKVQDAKVMLLARHSRFRPQHCGKTQRLALVGDITGGSAPPEGTQCIRGMKLNNYQGARLHDATGPV